MANYIGIDVGGTKIAGAFFSDQTGEMSAPHRASTPDTYEYFIAAVVDIVERVERDAGDKGPVGIGLPGAYDAYYGTANAPNIPYLAGRKLRDDLARLIGRPVRLANDANCMALAEAVDGAAKGAQNMIGLIVGTGVGAGIIIDGKIFTGRVSMAGEFGHLPLPFRAPEDGPVVACGCGQQGCIEKSIAGPALERLYTFMTGETATPPQIAESARAGEAKAIEVLDRYYEVFAKAMITVLHSLDPDIVVISGGMKAFEGLYTEVPKRMVKYTPAPKVETVFVPAQHGPESGLRGAAWLWR